MLLDDDDEHSNSSSDEENTQKRNWKLFHSLSLFEFLCNIKSSKLLNNNRRVKKGFYITKSFIVWS